MTPRSQSPCSGFGRSIFYQPVEIKDQKISVRKWKPERFWLLCWKNLLIKQLSYFRARKECRSMLPLSFRFFVHCGPDYTLSTSKVKWFSCTKISLFWIILLKFSVNMYKKKARALGNYPIVCRLFTPSHSLSKEPLNACPSTCNTAISSSVELEIKRMRCRLFESCCRGRRPRRPAQSLPRARGRCPSAHTGADEVPTSAQ